MNEVLEIKLLGGFSVWVNGNIISDQQWRSKRVRSLVKLLALAPAQRLQRDQILDQLWPDSDFTAAANNLHQTLFNARKIFEAAGLTCLVLEDGLLSLGNGAGVDVDQFEAAATEAQKSQDPALFRTALDLYSGDLLPGDLYEEWSVARRESLRQQRLKLLLDLARIYETRQEYAAGIEILGLVVETDRSHEVAHAGLMRLYALSGQRQQSLRQFQLLKDALHSELDVEPSPGTLRLYEEIQSGGTHPAEVQIITPPSTHRHNLPAQLTSFIGREKEIAELSQKIKTQRLVTLTGSGGTGKTRLALQVANELLDAFPEGIFLVELASLSDPALVPQACIQVLELIHQSGVPPQTVLLSYLEPKHVLLILDNCEHLITACTGLANALLKGCPQLHILATSREILSLPGEVPFRVPSLAFPDPRSLPDLAELGKFEAVRLFVERSEQVLPGFGLTAANAGSIVQICQRLDGIPLAIELAAARVRLMTVEQVASRLDNAFRILTGGSKAVLPRQQTLKATIDWSYDLLSPQERLLLQRLSVFAGGWTLDAAEAVGADEEGIEDCIEGSLSTSEVMDLLAQLVDKSLVLASIHQDGGRYHLLETIRQYALDRLMETGCGAAVRSRHLDYFARLSGEAEPHLRGKGQVEWLERLDEELDNLRAALEWSLSDRIELGLKIAADLLWFWHIRALFEEEVEWLGKLLAAEAQQRGQEPLAGECALQRARGLRTYTFHAGWGYIIKEITRAEQLALFQDSVAILRTLEPVSRRELGISLYYVFIWESLLGQTSHVHEEMLDIFQKENEKLYLSEYLFYNAVWLNKVPDEAIALLNLSLVISNELEDLDGISGRCLNLGHFWMLKGDYVQAEILILKSIEMSRKIRSIWFEGFAYGHLSKLAMAQGNYAETIHQAEEALKKYRGLNYLAQTEIPLQIIQQATWSQGNFESSMRCGQELIAAFAGKEACELSANLYLGRAAISQDELVQAEKYMKRALSSNLWKNDVRLGWNVITPHLLGWIALFSKQGKYPLCARLIGAVDSIYQQIAAGQVPRERSEYEEDQTATRAALGEEAFAAAFAEGQAMTLEQAMDWMTIELQEVDA